MKAPFVLAMENSEANDQAEIDWHRKVALGLTLFNGGIGLGLWALLWDRLGGSIRLTALLAVSAQFLFVLGLGNAAAIPPASRARPVAWAGVSVFGCNLILFFLAFAGEQTFLFIWQLPLAGLGLLVFLGYLLLLNRFLAKVEGEGPFRLHWWIALVSLGIAFAATLLVPGFSEWEEGVPWLTGIPGVLATGLLSSLILRSRQRVSEGATEGPGERETRKDEVR